MSEEEQVRRQPETPHEAAKTLQCSRHAHAAGLRSRAV